MDSLTTHSRIRSLWGPFLERICRAPLFSALICLVPLCLSPALFPSTRTHSRSSLACSPPPPPRAAYSRARRSSIRREEKRSSAMRRDTFSSQSCWGALCRLPHTPHHTPHHTLFHHTPHHTPYPTPHTTPHHTPHPTPPHTPHHTLPHPPPHTPPPTPPTPSHTRPCAGSATRPLAGTRPPLRWAGIKQVSHLYQSLESRRTHLSHTHTCRIFLYFLSSTNTFTLCPFEYLVRNSND